MEIRVNLCPDCDRCPEVVITDDCVCIGEGQNIVRLSHAEWNELVEAVKRAELGITETR